MAEEMFVLAQTLFLLSSLFANSNSVPSQQSYFIAWDVGQGSAHSFILSQLCLHFDLGGEKNPIAAITKLCRKKTQALILSHFDSDHYNFIPSLVAKSPVCLYDAPPVPKKIATTSWWKKLTPCNFQIPGLRKIFSGQSSGKSNSQSLVYLYDNKILLPGDSLRAQEQVWSESLRGLKIELLLAPHHGSQTSSSDSLLRYCRYANVWISARQKKFGHPHKAVTEAYRYFRMPHLSTSDWGHLVRAL